MSTYLICKHSPVRQCKRPITMLIRSPFINQVTQLIPSTTLPMKMMSLDSLSEPNSSPLWLTMALRGGELFAKRQGTVLDISRVRMRLEGLSAYATLCALLANGCLRLYSAVTIPKREEEQADKIKKRAYDAFYFFIVVSILSGSYTTVVFTLLALFSKTALGRNYDRQFLEFWSATAGIRESGLESFLYSLVCFELAFILSIFLRTEGKRRVVLVALGLIMASFSFSRWGEI